MKKKIILFFSICLILILIFCLNGMLFDKTILVSDLLAQYYIFLTKLIDYFKGTGTLLYTFDFGLGGSMFSVCAYYLISITNLLLNFFSYDNLYLYITIIIIIKMALCGVTMCHYLEYNFPNKKNIYLFSFSYVLSTYLLTNYFQIMWLDCYILAPLILLGIDKIIEEDNPLLYGVTLALAILSNYYMGFIICFFSVMYYIYKNLLKHNKLKNVTTYVITSILAGMMTMIINFTAFIEIMNSSRVNSISTGFNTDLAKIISGFFIGNAMEPILNYNHPKLYIGIFLVLLLFLYFINKKISKREKVVSGIFIGMILLFMVFNVLNSIWHAFSTPIGFNCRYVYLVNIVLIFLACKSFENIDDIPKRNYLIFLYFFFIICFVVFITNTNELYFIILNLLFVALYCIMLFSKETKKTILTVFVIELCINGYFTYNEFETLDSLNNMLDSEFTEIINKIQENEKDIFYRMDFKRSSSRTNENILYDYHSASSWLSTIKNSDLKFLNKINYDTSINSYNFSNYDITNSLFGIKYYADDVKFAENNKDEFIASYNDMNIYKNENALGLGYIVDEKVKNSLDCISSYECQEQIINYMTNDDSIIYEELNVKKINDLVSEHYVENDQLIYAYIETKSEESVNIAAYFNDEFLVGATNDFMINNIIKMNGVLPKNYNIGDKIEIILTANNNSLYDTIVKFYNYNYDVYLNKINKLKEKQLELSYFSDEYIKGTIEGGGVLFTSIPYSDNWKVYVDGNKVNTYNLFDMFLGVDVAEGQHTVEFKYEVSSFKVGITISLVSSLFFGLYIYKKSCANKKKNV